LGLKIHSSAGTDLTKHRPCTAVYLLGKKKKNLKYKQTHKVKTHVVQGSTVIIVMDECRILFYEFNCMLVTKLGEGYGTPLQYSCLENLIDGGTW